MSAWTAAGRGGGRAAAGQEHCYPWQRPLGAAARPGGMVQLRVWAPGAHRVAARIGEREVDLAPAGLGIWEAQARAEAGEDYFFLLNGGDGSGEDGRGGESGGGRAIDDGWLPDPCSRWQPHGIRGASRILDPARFVWSDGDWRGLRLEELVIYELHVGTFTPTGDFEGVIDQLPRLRDLGVTAIELMPIAEFPGVRGWGYDGVYPSAAHSAYGGPLALQRLIDAAHREGLGVLLDVVYNHVGASGLDALEAFGPYFTEHHETFWGRAINYDDAGCDPVREWVAQSAKGWVRDFHFDGLRLDAIHAIHDESAHHIVCEISERVHAARPGALVIAESALNDPRVIRPPRLGGHGCDAQWADDFHHALHTLLTGERDGYYADFGALADLAKAFHRPFVHDGTYSPFRGRLFGARAEDRPPEQFVVFSQNHDQVGNRAFGERLPAAARPLAALCTLLSPFTPLLFMGEEYGESAPFQFFTDHIDPEIAEQTRSGRRREFASFASFTAGAQLPDPQDEQTFLRSCLTHRGGDRALAELYRRLLALRAQMRAAGDGGGGGASSSSGGGSSGSGSGSGSEPLIAYEEQARWLTVRRGAWLLACNFSAEPQSVPCGEASEVVIATHGASIGGGGRLTLPALAGALLR